MDREQFLLTLSQTKVDLTYLVVASHVRHTFIFSSQLVLDFVDSIILTVHGTNQQIVGDVIQVAAEFQPGPSSTDVVSGALSLHLQHHKTKQTGKDEDD